MKKRMLAIALSLTMACTVLAGCGAGSGNTGETENGAVSEDTTGAEDSNSAADSSSSTEEAGGVKLVNGKTLTKVGFSAPAMDNEFQTNLSSSLEAACEANGIEYTVSEAQQSAATQTQQIENMVTSGCEAIVVSPVDLDGIKDALKNAKDSGVFVAMVGVIPESKDYYDVVANVDQTDLGSTAAKAAASWIDETFPDAEDGSVEVALLTLDNSEEAIKRDEALQSVEEYTSKAKIVATYDSTGASSIPTKAQEYTEMMLVEHPDVKCILCYSDFMGLPADEVVMRTAGVDPATFGIFGCDYSSAGAEAIAKSADNESTYRASSAFGVTFGQTVYDIMVGNLEVDDQGVYYEPAFELTVDNVDQYLN